jgi:tRNA modification GTPase
VLWVVDATSPEAEWGSGRSHEVGAEPGPSAGGHKLTWLVRNKADLLPRPASPREQKNEHTSVEAVYDRKTEHIFILSAETGSGLEILLRALTRQAEQAFGGAEPAVITRERHRLALQDAEAALARASRSLTEELLAEELRLAARALERLTGRVDVEDVLDVIFRDFCIGK